ncbi:MAG: hypothetical protein O9329_08605, partial [Microcystis sp. LE19-12.2C]|nr:hypothetical protein [Microcystis sp. LE19-12.2C]
MPFSIRVSSLITSVHCKTQTEEPYLGAAEKVFRGGRVWGVGCGVWGFTHFQVVNYLIFREKIPKFSPQSLQ